MSKIISIYIDGFNFFKALKNIAKNKPKDKGDWDELPELDLVKLFRGYYSGADFDVRVKLFMAPPKKNYKGNLFYDYIGYHIDRYPTKFTFVKGRFDDYNGEKLTDVNLACEMIIDSYEKLSDQFILVSADSDFTKPLMHLLFNKKRTVRLFTPPGRKGSALNNINDKWKEKCSMRGNKERTRFKVKKMDRAYNIFAMSGIIKN
jgi:uncharacterized LabA/DUF88 family protein